MGKTAENKDQKTKAQETVAVTAATPEKEKITIPPSDTGSSTVFLCVNGKSLTLQRGKTVEVDPEFAEVWRNSLEQQQSSIDFQKENEDKEVAM